jgi:hypothetical protein
MDDASRLLISLSRWERLRHLMALARDLMQRVLARLRVPFLLLGLQKEFHSRARRAG